MCAMGNGQRQIAFERAWQRTALEFRVDAKHFDMKAMARKHCVTADRRRSQQPETLQLPA